MPIPVTKGDSFNKQMKRTIKKKRPSATRSKASSKTKSTGAKKMTREQRIAKRQKELASKSKGGFEYFIFKEGTRRLRAVPIIGEEEFAVEVMRFYIGGDVKSFISPATFGQPCAVYEKYEELKESDDEDEVEMASKMGLGRRYMMPFYAYKDERGDEVDTDAGVKLALLTSSQYQMVLNFYMEAEKGDFTDPDDGYDMKFKREGKGRNDTTYTVLDCKPSEGYGPYVNKEYDPEEMVQELLPTYEQTEEYLDKFMGDFGMDEDDEELEERPRRKKRPAAGKKRRRSSDV